MSISRSGSHRRTRAAATSAVLVAAASLLLAATPAAATPAAATPAVAARSTEPTPTVVLVHGAWADSSSWDGVVSRLLRDGYPVDVFPTPLRGLATDTAALRDYLGAIDGPVILVGHSYGGAVVTDAATGNPSIRALVYVDAFAPDEGESVAMLPGPDSVLANPDPTQVFDFVPDTLPPTPSTDLYVKRSVFVTAFANDLPAAQGQVLATTQRPVTLGALNEPSTTPAWKTIPSWYELGTLDKVIPPAAQFDMAARAQSHIIRVASGHLPMVSRPAAVARIVERAAEATG